MKRRSPPEKFAGQPWFGRKVVRPLAQDRDPWTRQPGESARAYAYFCLYRDMGPVRRSLREVAQQVGRSMAFIGRLSVRWQWVFRVEQYDAYQERLRQETLRREQEEMLRRHAEAAAAAIQKIILRMRGGLDRVMTPEGPQEVEVPALLPQEMDASQMARLLDVAVKVERLARGLPTEHAAISGTGDDANVIAQRILEDAETRSMVAELFARLAERHGSGPGEVGADGLGDVRQPRSVAAGRAPRPGQ